LSVNAQEPGAAVFSGELEAKMRIHSAFVRAAAVIGISTTVVLGHFTFAVACCLADLPKRL
jgi:hypothetical protein